MKQSQVNSVTGPISSDEMGITLMHEHILFGYPGWEGDLTLAPFDRQTIVNTGVEVLNHLKTLGLATYVDATTNDNGRNPEIYKEISEKTGVNIICATGYSFEERGASAYWKFRSSLGDVNDEIYELFTREITVGIRNTRIKAGVIKVGSSQGKITDYEKMMFTAAARAQQDTGVPIITHTQEGTMGPEQAEFLIAQGADPAKIQIGHMCDNLDIDYQLRTLEQGVYVSWDRMGLQGLVGCPIDEKRYATIIYLIGKGFADKIMISHDYIINWLGRPLNLPEAALPLIANWHPSHLFKNIIPVLKEGGVTDEQIETIIKNNPKRLFT